MIWKCVTRSPQTAYEISKEIFGNDLDDFDKGLARTDTYIPLTELEKEETIEKIQKGETILFRSSKETTVKTVSDGKKIFQNTC